MINLDALAEQHFACNDPQFADWDSIEREERIEDLRFSINIFAIDEDDPDESRAEAKNLIAEAKKLDAEDELEPLRNILERLGF